MELTRRDVDWPYSCAGTVLDFMAHKLEAGRSDVLSSVAAPHADNRG